MWFSICHVSFPCDQRFGRIFNRGLSHGYLLLSAEPRQGDAGGELYVQALKQVPTILVVKKDGCLEDHPSEFVVSNPPFFKPFSPFGRGITPFKGRKLSLVINHLLTGIILQVHFGWNLLIKRKCCYNYMTSKILHVPSEVVFGSPLKAEFQEVFGDPHTDPHEAVGRLGYYMDLYIHWGCCTQIHLFPRSTLRHGQYYHHASIRKSALQTEWRWTLQNRLEGFTQNKSCLFP